MSPSHPAAGRASYPVVLAFLALLLVAVVVLAASVGAVQVPIRDVLHVLVAWLGFTDPAATDPLARRVVTGVRLPRILVAAAAGAALAVAGTLLSGALRNPLASPVTTGGAGGALLGAGIVVFLAPLGFEYLTGTRTGTDILIVRAFAAGVGAFLVTWIVVHTTTAHGARVLAGPLLLAGLAMNAIVGSLVALLLFLGASGAQAAATLVVSWMFGGLLATASAAGAGVVALFLLAALVVWILIARPLDLILVGEEEAAAGGVDVGRTRVLAVGAAALATGAAVAAAGIIAFVGLIAPVVMRRIVGPDHLRMLPAAALFGAVLLVAADAAGRVLGAPGELPAGVLTAAVGAPVLLVLLRRMQGVQG